MYCSLDDVKLYLGIAAADLSEDTLITSLLESAQSDIDNLCGRSFEASTATRHYGPAAIEGSSLLLGADLLTVTTLTNGDGVVLGGSTYRLWPRDVLPAQRIRLMSSYLWTFADVDSEISVAGTWGYSATAPASVQQATREYVHYLYHSPDSLKQRKQGASRADILPDHITQLLSSVRKRTL